MKEDICSLSPDGRAKGGLVFECACGRIQSYAPAGVQGGVTIAEAEQLGWKLIDEKWECPFCTGNTANLHKFFKQHDTQTEKEKYDELVSTGHCFACAHGSEPAGNEYCMSHLDEGGVNCSGFEVITFEEFKRKWRENKNKYAGEE